MRMPVRYLSLGLAAVSLAACANGPAAVGPGNSIITASPAPVPGYDWFYDDTGGETRLSYGVESSDDLKLGLSCTPGDGKLSLSANGSTGAREIHLESGGDTERFAAHAEPSALHDGDFLTAEASTALPVFQRFRRVGWIALLNGSERTMMAPQPGSAQRVERFFAACG